MGKDKQADEVLRTAILAALKAADPTAFIGSDDMDAVTPIPIDGRFNLARVAILVRKELDRHRLLIPLRDRVSR